MRNPLRIALCAAVVLACLPVTGQAAVVPTSLAISPLVRSGPFSRPPAVIASAGTLQAGQTVNLTVQTQPGATVYLWLSGGGSGLPHKPTPFVADGNGQVPVAYQPAAASSGMDTIRATDKPSGAAVTAHASYNYARVVGYAFPANRYFWGQDIAVEPLDSAGNPVPYAGVFLSFTMHRVCPTPAGSCPTGGSMHQDGGSLDPRFAYLTNRTGQYGFPGGTITLIYHLPGTLPIGGYDLLTAADAATGATGQDQINF